DGKSVVKVPPAGIVVKPIDPALEELRSEYEYTLRSLVSTPNEKADDQWEALLASYIKLNNPLATIASPELYRVAFLGGEALATNRKSVAARISDELDFATSTSAALSQVMRGLLNFLTLFGALAVAIGYSLVILSKQLGVTSIDPVTWAKVVPIVIATV